MKILIIHNNYSSNSISGENIVFNNEVFLLKQKLGEESIFTYDVSNDNINIINLLFSIWFSFKHYYKVKQIIKDNKIDIVHVHNFYPVLTPSIFKASKDAGAKTIHTLHNYRLWCISGTFYRDGIGICELCTKKAHLFSGIKYKCYRNKFFTSLLAQMSFWFYKSIKVFDNIDIYFVLTEFQKNKVIELGLDQEKVFNKPNSIKKFILHQQHKSGYIFVGRLEESKGIIQLLEMWRLLDKEYILQVIGSGDLEQYLQREYKNVPNITFLGKCTRDDTIKYISQSQYLIQPSLLYETFGLTILEAMMVGTPVIGFNIGTRADFIKHEYNGFLCNKDTFKDTVIQSYKYLDYNILSNNAISTALKYEDSILIQHQIEIYQKVLSKKRDEH
jgi:glycosyltransferase involved in cell wall biosynthesis